MPLHLNKNNPMLPHLAAGMVAILETREHDCRLRLFGDARTLVAGSRTEVMTFANEKGLRVIDARA